jgi:hypothetical protein
MSKMRRTYEHGLLKRCIRYMVFVLIPVRVEYEAELRKAGLYESYEKSMMQGSLKSFSSEMWNKFI